MAKKSKKQRKSKGPSKRPNLSPLSMLRPRLDGLMNNPEWLIKNDDDILVDIKAVVQGIDADAYLPTLIRSTESAPVEVGQRLNQLIPKWLAADAIVQTLVTLLDEENIPIEDQPRAKEWLVAAGVDEDELNKERESSFADAYFASDDKPSQGVLFIFWYVNRQRTRVSGLSMLVDYHPPWEGSTKEQYITSQMSLKETIRKHIDIWHERALTVTQLDGESAKAKFAEILRCNMKEGIRLHSDLIVEKQKVIRHVLSLPEPVDGPTISLNEFEALCHEGEKPETLMFRERTFGYQTRMDDGREITLIRDPSLE